ncbi:hypothetical protein D3C81_1857350 [compost metagenome]
MLDSVSPRWIVYDSPAAAPSVDAGAAGADWAARRGWRGAGAGRAGSDEAAAGTGAAGVAACAGVSAGDASGVAACTTVVGAKLWLDFAPAGSSRNV